jgi:hypothetical protein
MLKKIHLIISLFFINTLFAQSNSYTIFKKSLLQNKQNETIVNFERWIKEENYNLDSLLILYADDELDSISSNNWLDSKLEIRIKEIYYSSIPNIIDKESSFRLWTIMGEDQRYRTYYKYVSKKIRDRNRYLDSILKIDINEYIKQTKDFKIQKNKNEEFVLNWINNNGFPSIANIGENAYLSCFLIIQHSDNPKNLKHFLYLMKKEIRKDSNFINNYNITYATMYDRYLTLKNRKQLYATQFIKRNIDSEYSYYPIKNVKKLNKRRARLNLPPLDLKKIKTTTI